MTRLTEAQLAQLRQQPQGTKLWMSIFQPNTIFTANINDAAIDRRARTITYNNASGTYTDIQSGMTMLIGTTPGAMNVGKIRVRSATPSTIIVSENSNIEWQDGLYLTIQKYWELWPVFPRIINDPANEENVIFYKDYDIPYSNQNSILGTFLNAGPHRAAFLENGVANLWYSSTGTYNLVGVTGSYQWTFEGGTPSSSNSPDPGYVSYNTPGQYVTQLVFSGTNGAVDTTYRYVSIYDRPENGINVPILKWEMSNLNGSRDGGGYSATFKVYEDIPLTEHAVVVLFADDIYGTDTVSLGGNYPNAEKIFFVGYVQDGSIHYNYEYSYTEFVATSLTTIMKDTLGFSVSVESKASPSKWYELLDLDCRRAVYHYLRWHTTALSLADFQFLGDDQKIQYFDADRESMYDAVDNLMRDALIGSYVSDRQGKTWAEIKPEAYANPTGTFTSIMDIRKTDWMGEPVIEEQLSDKVSYMEYGGIAYSGVVTGTYSALISSAPGNAPGFRGTTENHEGMALLGQEQLNALVGNLFANENSKYPSIKFDMALDARNLDIAPYETVNVLINPEDTARNLLLSGLYYPSTIDWKYDGENGVLLPTTDMNSLLNGIPGETVVIPSSPQEGGIGNGFNIPGLQIPAIPPLTFPVGAVSTGSSCCDALASLGIGLGVYSALYTRASCVTPSAGLTNEMFGWDYCSNPSMYNAVNGNMPFQNTGTLTSYTFNMSLDWLVVSQAVIFPSLTYSNSIIIAVYNADGSGESLAFSIEGTSKFESGMGDFVAGNVVGNSGNYTKDLVVSAPATFKFDKYMHAYVVSNSSQNEFRLCFSNIRLKLTGNP